MALPTAYVAPLTGTRLPGDARLPADLNAFWAYLPALQAYVNNLASPADVTAVLTAYYNKTDSDARYALAGAVAGGPSIYNYYRQISSFVQTSAGWTATQTLQAAFDWMALNKQPLAQTTPLDLYLTGTVWARGQYFQVFSARGCLNLHGTNFASITMDTLRVTSTSPINTSYLNRSSTGNAAGSLIIVTEAMFGFRIEGVTFADARFGITFLTNTNTPCFVACHFVGMDCGVLGYQGLQNPTFIGCRAEQVGVICIGTATAFTSLATGTETVNGVTSTWDYRSTDNSFLDGIRFANEGGYTGQFQGPVTLPDFDTWFAASFTQPGVDLVTKAGLRRFRDSSGVEIPANDPRRYPSGRIFYLPAVTGRAVNGVYLDNMDIRGPIGRGVCFIGTGTATFSLASLVWEITSGVCTGIIMFDVQSIGSGEVNLARVNSNAFNSTMGGLMFNPTMGVNNVKGLGPIIPAVPAALRTGVKIVLVSDANGATTWVAA